MLQRMTYLQSVSFYRRIDAPSVDATTNKLTGPRHYHTSGTSLLGAYRRIYGNYG